MVKTDILVVTALALEFKAVEQLLMDTTPVRHPTGKYHSKGIFVSGNLSCTVGIVQCGAGNTKAARETESAIEFFQPNYIFFVGVGGGIKDVKIGDVVASSYVIHYEGGKADDQYKARLESYQASYELVSLAELISRDELWQHRIADGVNSYKSDVKPIAAGEKVIASTRSVTYELIKQCVSQAVAVEMEGFGFLAPVHAHHAKGIVIRGISDLLENKEAADESGSQPLAARNAAAFWAQMIETLLNQQALQTNAVESSHLTKTLAQHAESPVDHHDPLQNLQWRKQLVETLALLYEKGPTDGNVWKRAGGHVRFLTNSDSNETQWFAALDHMAKGGAGNITLETLLQTVREDFGGNASVKRLCKEAGLN